MIIIVFSKAITCTPPKVGVACPCLPRPGSYRDRGNRFGEARMVDNHSTVWHFRHARFHISLLKVQKLTESKIKQNITHRCLFKLIPIPALVLLIELFYSYHKFIITHTNYVYFTYLINFYVFSYFFSLKIGVLHRFTFYKLF